MIWPNGQITPPTPLFYTFNFEVLLIRTVSWNRVVKAGGLLRSKVVKPLSTSLSYTFDFNAPLIYVLLRRSTSSFYLNAPLIISSASTLCVEVSLLSFPSMRGRPSFPTKSPRFFSNFLSAPLLLISTASKPSF